MPVRFEKTAEGPLGRVDGFDGKRVYQMVPEGGSRFALNAVTADELVEVAFEPTGIAQFGTKSFDPPSPLPFSDTAVSLQPKTRFKFELVGLKKGNTTLVMRDRNGKPVATLLISVKGVVNKSYALCRLSDKDRNCPWPVADLRPMMQKVEKTYFQQANVKLVEKSTVIHEVNVNDRDLGNPLVPARISKLDGKTINQLILSRAPLSATGADLTIFFTWDLKGLTRDVVGTSIGQTCYVEFNSTNPLENALTTAHEIGHGLGLFHSAANNLMAGDGDSRNSELQQFEIDAINQTDQNP